MSNNKPLPHFRTNELRDTSFFVTSNYLSEFYILLQQGKINESEEMYHDAKILDKEFFKGNHPRYLSMVEGFREFGLVDKAIKILEDAKNKDENFFKYSYAELLDLYLKTKQDEKFLELIKESYTKDLESFMSYGYKKLLEYRILNKKYQEALLLIEIARKARIKKLSGEDLNSYNSLPEEIKKNYNPNLEDILLKKKLEERLRINSNN